MVYNYANIQIFSKSLNIYAKVLKFYNSISNQIQKSILQKGAYNLKEVNKVQNNCKKIQNKDKSM